MHIVHKQYQKNRLDLVQLYGRIKPIIETKITDFCQIGKKATNLELFRELLFCLLTPQSKAETCLTVVNDILHDELLLTGTQETLSEAIRCVRFRHTKAKNIIKARNIAFNASLIPTINMLFAVGLVSLPGMMTGQILSGISPFIAARYQIMVMCMLFASSGISAACFLSLINNQYRSS